MADNINRQSYLKRTNSVQKISDLVAISASVLCFVHCLMTPVVLILLPVLGSGIVGGDLFHRFLLLVILPSSAMAVSIGCRRHKDKKVMLLGAVGMLVLISAGVAGIDILGESGERILTIAGGIVLIAGHLRNFRLCREDHCDHE